MAYFISKKYPIRTILGSMQLYKSLLFLMDTSENANVSSSLSPTTSNLKTFGIQFTPLWFFQSPVSTLLEYYGLFQVRPDNPKMEPLVADNSVSESSNSNAGGANSSNGEVSIMIMWAGEHQGIGVEGEDDGLVMDGGEGVLLRRGVLLWMRKWFLRRKLVMLERILPTKDLIYNKLLGGLSRFFHFPFFSSLFSSASICKLHFWSESLSRLLRDIDRIGLLERCGAIISRFYRVLRFLDVIDWVYGAEASGSLFGEA